MSDFLDGFAAETNLGRAEAEEQWAAFSRQLTDRERKQIEDGGYEVGVIEGQSFNGMFGTS
jgi:hypothetical protein